MQQAFVKVNLTEYVLVSRCFHLPTKNAEVRVIELFCNRILGGIMSDKQSQSVFWTVNFAFGVASFFAIAFGSVGVYGALGARYLRSIGLNVPVTTETSEVVGAVSYVSTIAGFAGFGSAIAAAYVGGTMAAKREYELYRKQDKASFLLDARISSVERVDVSTSVCDSQVKVYHLTKNEQIAGDKLIVLGNVFSGVAFIAHASSEQVDTLVELFECDCSDGLVGKVFTSFHAYADEALKDFLVRQSEFIACLNEGFDRDDIDKCAGCVNLRAKNGTLCPIYEEGWYGSGKCPDKQIIANYPMAPYEDESIFRDYNKLIEKSNAFFFKNDDGTILLCDQLTNRYFLFDWFGKRDLLSDKLTELPVGADLESYLQYYSARDVRHFEDYSFRIAELRINLKGIANVELCGKHFDISVTLLKNKELGVDYDFCYKFNRYGFPKYPHESKAPVALKGKYNLVNFVAYVKQMHANNCNTPFSQHA